MQVFTSTSFYGRKVTVRTERRRHVPLVTITSIQVASPCSTGWSLMSGDDRIRHCPECNLNVHNLSAMTEREVQRLFKSQEGRLCVRFYRRADGTMLMQDCPRGRRAVIRRVSRIAGAALSAIMSVSFAVAQAGPQAAPRTLVRIDQGETGNILLVIDPNGAAIANAHVVFMNVDSETLGKAVTNQVGQLDNLTAGIYIVEVQAPGFEMHREMLRIKEQEINKIVLKVEAGKWTTGGLIEGSPSLIAPAMAPIENLQTLPFASLPPERKNAVKRFFLGLGRKLGS